MSENEFVTDLLTFTRTNDISSLEKHLLSISNVNDYLNRNFIENNKQKCTLLAIACLKGYIEMIDMLLTHFTPDLEVLNDVILSGHQENFNEHLFIDVSVLWIAASMNNFSIVKLLVEHGANINHQTKTQSTALRGACYNGNLDMVRYLIERGANIHLAKENNDTNLMVSVCHKHLHIITYLVRDLNIDVNICDTDGRTALYDAVNSGSLEIVEFLLEHGARNIRAMKDRISPLLWAAEKRRLDLVKAIGCYCTLIERIEAEELLGSSFICAPQRDQHLDQAFEHFRQALELRYEHNFPKQLRLSTHSNDIFNNQQECQTIDDLKQIEFNFDRLYIEALLVRERLLGSTNEEYRYSLCYRGAILADSGQDHIGLEYWIYELYLCQQYEIPLDAKHLRRFVSLFSGILSKKRTLPVEALFTILVAITNELNTTESKYFNDNLYSLLFVITILSRILTSNDINPTDRTRLIRHLHLINQRNFVLFNSKKSLLHLSLDNETLVDDYYIKRVCKYVTHSSCI